MRPALLLAASLVFAVCVSSQVGPAFAQASAFAEATADKTTGKQERAVRARDLGIPFQGANPGPLNAITDVAGVEVGFTALISGEGPPILGKGPVRKGAFRREGPSSISMLSNDNLNWYLDTTVDATPPKRPSSTR